MFNEQIKEALKNLLLNKFGGNEAAPQASRSIPIMPGLAEGTMLLGKVRRDLADQRETPPVAPEQPVAAEPTTPPVMPPASPSPAPMAMPKPQMPTQASSAQPPAAIPQPEAAQQPELGQYNDTARQQLYADLQKRMQRGAGFQALGGLADTMARAGGSKPTDYSETIGKKLAADEKIATDRFDVGRKGAREEIADYLSQKKDSRDFGLKEKELGLKHDEIRANREATASNKALALSEKTDQFNANKTRQFREEVMGGKPMAGYMTVHGMARSVRMAAKDPSAYGDLSSIYALVKGLDPTSVVREGEIALMKEVSGLRDQLVSTLERWGGRGPINPNQMKDIEKIMGRLEQISADNVRFHAGPTLNQARSMGLKESEILGDLPTGQSAAQPAQAAPAASGMTPEQRRTRIAQLRAQQGQ